MIRDAGRWIRDADRGSLTSEPPTFDFPISLPPFRIAARASTRYPAKDASSHSALPQFRIRCLADAYAR